MNFLKNDEPTYFGSISGVEGRNVERGFNLWLYFK